MKFLLFISYIFFASGAWAECSSMPSCDELNFKDTSCQGDFITCPFDATKKKCLNSKVDCAELGFTIGNKSMWCSEQISCPTNAIYTACVKAFENPCPSGYDSRITSVNDCGEQGSNGWTFSSTTIQGKDGRNITCGACKPRTCSGYYESYKSVDSCGSPSTGWKFYSCYAGDTLMGKCEKKTCYDYGYHAASDIDSGRWLCDQTNKKSVYLGSAPSTCYDCVSCSEAQQYTDYYNLYYGNQSPIDICYKAKTKGGNGLFGCYKQYSSFFSVRKGSYYYTANKCDTCLPIGASVAYYGLQTFCCKNGQNYSTGPNWTCN